MSIEEITEIYKKAIVLSDSFEDFTPMQQKALEGLKNPSVAIAKPIALSFARQLSKLLDDVQESDFDKDYYDGRYGLNGKTYYRVSIPDGEGIFVTVGYTTVSNWYEKV